MIARAREISPLRDRTQVSQTRENFARSRTVNSPISSVRAGPRARIDLVSRLHSRPPLREVG